MTKALKLLALVLLVVMATGAGPEAVIIPEPDHPGDGGGVSDDHPWGGDRIGGGDGSTTLDKYSRVSSVTGFPLVDIIIERWLQSLSLKSVPATGEYRGYRTIESRVVEFRAPMTTQSSLSGKEQAQR